MAILLFFQINWKINKIVKFIALKNLSFFIVELMLNIVNATLGR